MTRAGLLKMVAPCRLVCYTCASCEHGIVKEHADKLIHYLTGVSEFSETHHPQDKEKTKPHYLRFTV